VAFHRYLAPLFPTGYLSNLSFFSHLESKAAIHLAAGGFVKVSAVAKPVASEVAAVPTAARVFVVSRQLRHFHLRFIPLLLIFHSPPSTLWCIRQLVQNRVPVIVTSASLARQ